jgi:hypothetical protein
MDSVVAWTWKTHANGERRGGMKAHAFENSTRRSLCRKYDDGQEWSTARQDVAIPGACCSTCLCVAATAIGGIPARLSQRTEEH